MAIPNIDYTPTSVAGIEIAIFGADNPPDTPIVFVCHGLESCMQKKFDYCRELREAGLIAITLDQRNHGRRQINPMLREESNSKILVEPLGEVAGTVHDIQYDSLNATGDSIEIINYSIHNVNDDLYYARFQEAIDAAATADGETLAVLDTVGVYRDTMNITKGLTIRKGAGNTSPRIVFDGIGIDRTGYEGWARDVMIRIFADNTVLKGLIIDGDYSGTGQADCGLPSV